MTTEDSELGSAAAEARKLFTELLAHRIDISPESANSACRYCPICQLMRQFNQPNDEVKAHLKAAAAAITAAMSELMRTEPPTSETDKAQTGD